MLSAKAALDSAQNGDTIEISIEGIGTLGNPVADA